MCRQPFIETLFQYLFLQRNIVSNSLPISTKQKNYFYRFLPKTQYFPLTKPHPIGKNIVKGIDNDFTPRRFAKMPLLSRFVCRMRLLLTSIIFSSHCAILKVKERCDMTIAIFSP